MRHLNKMLLAAYVCAAFPIVVFTYYAGISVAYTIIGCIYWQATEDAKKTAPPPGFAGTWTGRDKSILLVSDDGVASFRDGSLQIDWNDRELINGNASGPGPGTRYVHSAWEIDGGRIHADTKQRWFSVTLFGRGRRFHVDSYPDASKLVLDGVPYQRTGEGGTGIFGEGDEPL